MNNEGETKTVPTYRNSLESRRESAGPELFSVTLV